MMSLSSKFNRFLSAGGFSLWLALIFTFSESGAAAEQKTLTGHVPNAVAKQNLKPIGRVPSTGKLQLAIGLPLRNENALTNFLMQLYDPTSTNFHHYLEPAQFTEKFGPTETDYQRVINFAKSNGFQIRRTFEDRRLVDVSATIAAIENAFHVKMQNYQHPKEMRQFFAPDVEPSVDSTLPIVFIAGLNNFSIPKRMDHKKPGSGNGDSLGGTAPDGFSFMGKDYRTAYVPGVSLTGSGKIVGLVEFAGYFLSDITNYEATANISPLVPLVNVQQPDFTNSLTGEECPGDIEVVISMAPGLSKVVVFEGTNYSDPDFLLQNMASSNQIKQFSCSWEMPYDVVAEGYLMQMASQGQSFCAASGDGGAYISGYEVWPGDDPYVTSVGGTYLTMTANAGAYVSEVVWNEGLQGESTGGVSSTFGCPLWQQAVNLGAAGGSLIMRNFPDVAMNADNVWIYSDHSGASWQGTSFAAPLWAGFTALVNQQLVADGKPTIGLMNPALYSIAEGASYSSCFHDITSGNNTWSGSTNQYYAETGYDLCTGWGSTKGSSLITALANLPATNNVVFVDFLYSGSSQTGAFTTPFKTLAGATSAVASGGTIIFNQGGSSSETMTISKPMILNSINGTATIGN